MTAPRTAPTTPPRLNAVSPYPAISVPKLAPASSDGTQLVPIYTDSRQKKNEAHRASVSRRNSGTNSAPADGRDTAFSVGSTNVVSIGSAWPRRRSSATSSGQRCRCRARYRGDSGST